MNSLSLKANSKKVNLKVQTNILLKFDGKIPMVQKLLHSQGIKQIFLVVITFLDESKNKY